MIRTTTVITSEDYDENGKVTGTHTNTIVHLKPETNPVMMLHVKDGNFFCLGADVPIEIEANIEEVDPVALIKAGTITIEQVPADIRSAVAQALEA